MDGSMDDTLPLAPDAPDVPNAGVDVGEGCAVMWATLIMTVVAVAAVAVGVLIF
ncbi:MAG: hypothetical protein WC657_06850 [Candidatus Paceibacterota bacterium]|jgi:hypothetical protein